jgi:uncharacterized repeat protein (TIGR03803 family)
MGGAYNGGTVFKIDSNLNETVVHSFGAPGDGQFPYGGLAMDANGNLYGTTLMGGDFQIGTVFKIDNAGNYSVLHSGVDGKWPRAGGIEPTARCFCQHTRSAIIFRKTNSERNKNYG